MGQYVVPRSFYPDLKSPLDPSYILLDSKCGAKIQHGVDLKPDLQDAFLKDTPLHRVGSPDEVAEAAVFLASNAFANNCVLNLDGGLSTA